MRAGALAAVAVAAALGGCSLFRRAPPPPPATPKYTVGPGYQLGGTWFYPREMTQYRATGLATVAPDRSGLTADGERSDATALEASHQTLQLPAILRVTNMDTGTQILVRINDRGPPAAGRIIGLSKHAADLLGVKDGTRVRLQMDEAMSRSVAEKLGGGPRVDIAAAPRAAVQAQQLAPPPGIGVSSRGRSAGGATLASADAASGPAVPDRLPDQVTQTRPEPGQIYLRADEFGRIDYAQRLAAQLSGLNPQIERNRDGRTERYAVRAGPFATVAAADAALDQARRAGVIDSRLVVE